MVKRIKFALELKDGVKVRSLDELRNHFDIEKIVTYFLNGKLQKWLEDRYYKSEAEAIQNMDSINPDIALLCHILGVDSCQLSSIDVAAIQKQNKKLDLVKQLTNDPKILANISHTALTQEDLMELLNAGEKTIYLCGKTFSIPVDKEYRTYIGICGKPNILIDVCSIDELERRHLSFINIQMPENIISIPENKRYLKLLGNYTIDKSILCNPKIYSDGEWKDFVYILLQCYPLKQRASQSVVLSLILPCLGLLNQKVSEAWEQFLNYTDIEQIQVNGIMGNYQGKYVNGYTWYDIVCEFIRYFTQKDISSWVQYVSRSEFEFKLGSARKIKYSWAVNVFCEVYSYMNKMSDEDTSLLLLLNGNIEAIDVLADYVYQKILFIKEMN